MWSPALQWMMWAITRPWTLMFWAVSQVLRVFSSRQPVAPVSNRLLLYSATELARLIRCRKLKCTEAIEAYIERVKEVNPVINAVVQSRFDSALKEAADVDLHLASTVRTSEEIERDQPLLGVPVTIKESIPVAGMSNSAGVPALNRVAPKDCSAVASLRAAGAIPILVSNTPELCLFWESYNPVTGRTNNPYDPRRTPGGSSGGEGALLGSAASVIGLGSDIGGSGRLPASFCGVFGHKPSSGYIVTEGHMPYSEDPRWRSVFVFAPMARYAEDLPVLLKAAATDKVKLKSLRLDEPVDLRHVKFYFMDSDGNTLSQTVSRDVRTALFTAITYIERTYKVTVREMEIDEMKYSAELSLVTLIRGKPCHNIFQKSPDDVTEWKSVLWETVRWVFGCSPHTLYALFYGIFKRAADKYPISALNKMEECKDIIYKKFCDHLGDNGVLLFPVYPSASHYHMQVYYRAMSVAYMSIFNVLDMPSTACPVTRDCRGLPVGIQVVAGRGQDRLTLAVAREFERAFGGWVPPTSDSLMEVKA